MEVGERENPSNDSLKVKIEQLRCAGLVVVLRLPVAKCDFVLPLIVG